jgi:hypothetical protein
MRYAFPAPISEARDDADETHAYELPSEPATT